MSPYDHYAQMQKMASYGRRTGIIVSLLVHALALFGLVWMGMAGEPKKDDFGRAVQVKLGGPRNLNTGGRKSRAATAGVTKPQARAQQKKQTATPPPPPKKKQRRTKPQAKEVAIGTKNKRRPPKKQPPPTPVAETSRSGSTYNTAPTAPSDVRSNRARGNVREGTGTGVVAEIGDGSEVTNVEELQFRTYLAAIAAAVEARWNGTSPMVGITRIEFTIHRDGSVTDVKIADTSGYPFLDKQARRAVMGLDLPPLPQGYEGDTLLMALKFHYGEEKQ
ncbi:MAG: energy transducer TonB [Acidobacteriota bacterium]|nr:energy transducer TonB [Acidobacteriota bacterium]